MAAKNKYTTRRLLSNLTVVALFFLPSMNNNCFGQVNYVGNLNGNTLLSYGLYIENLNITIPWGIQYDSLEHGYLAKYLHKFYTRKKYYILAIDSVIIFNGVRANLHFQSKPDCLFCKSSKLFEMDGIIDSADFGKLKTYFEIYTQKPENNANGKSMIRYGSKIDGCILLLGKYFKNEQYGLWIQSTFIFK